MRLYWRNNEGVTGLPSYGVDNLDLYRRAAGYVDRVLKGETPANLPVQFADKFELVINLKTAKAHPVAHSITSSVRASSETGTSRPGG